MGSKINFADKVLSRIDRLDRESVQGYLTILTREKKKAEFVFDRINEGIVLLTEEGIVTFANRQAFLWFGFHRFLKARSRLEDLTEEAAIKKFIHECLKHPSEVADQEFRILSPREMVLRIHWVPFEVDDEKGILFRIENLTQDRAASDEEARVQRIESLIRLTAGVAHEIGNPLNAIRIHIELLKQEVGAMAKAQRKGLLKLIDVLGAETRRLDQIVRSFLRATREPPLRFRIESLNEILEEAVDFLRPELKKRKVHPRVTLDGTLTSFLLDRDRLRQAFINLIKNSMEAMPHGGEIAISTALRDKLCFVRFADQGQGIAESDLPHIFEAYYTTKEEGSGLGLTQVYQAVREHAGRIDVKSLPRKGSVFTLILPVRKERLSLPQPRLNKKEETEA